MDPGDSDSSHLWRCAGLLACLPACLTRKRVKEEVAGPIVNRRKPFSWRGRCLGCFAGQINAKLLGKRRIIWSRHKPTSSSSASDLMIFLCAAVAADQIQSNALAAFSKLAWTHFLPHKKTKKSPILWCSSWSNYDHQKRTLAIFGFILDMKVQKNPESFYIFGYNSESFYIFGFNSESFYIFGYLSLELIINIWQNLEFFFPSKPWAIFFH